MARRERTLVEKVIRFFEGGGRWTRHDLYRRGCYCLGGAAALCAGQDPRAVIIDVDTQEEFARSLGFVPEGEYRRTARGSMYRWNDDPKRTRRQVMQRLYEARDRERAARKAAVRRDRS